jgi:hypothetical protein
VFQKLTAAFVSTLSPSDNNVILTNGGSLRKASLAAGEAILLDTLPLVFMKGQWVKCGTNNMLWLPCEYRPHHVDVHGNTLGLAYESGRVLIIELAF